MLYELSALYRRDGKGKKGSNLQAGKNGPSIATFLPQPGESGGKGFSLRLCKRRETPLLPGEEEKKKNVTPSSADSIIKSPQNRVAPTGVQVFLSGERKRKGKEKKGGRNLRAARGKREETFHRNVGNMGESFQSLFDGLEKEKEVCRTLKHRRNFKKRDITSQTGKGGKGGGGGQVLLSVHVTAHAQGEEEKYRPDLAGLNQNRPLLDKRQEKPDNI